MLNKSLQFEIKATRGAKYFTYKVGVHISLGRKLDCEIPETKMYINYQEV